MQVSFTSKWPNFLRPWCPSSVCCLSCLPSPRSGASVSLCFVVRLLNITIIPGGGEGWPGPFVGPHSLHCVMLITSRLSRLHPDVCRWDYLHVLQRLLLSGTRLSVCRGHVTYASFMQCLPASTCLRLLSCVYLLSGYRYYDRRPGSTHVDCAGHVYCRCASPDGNRPQYHR
jgi:hypothetical protein